jgi:hypothetical protein
LTIADPDYRLRLFATICELAPPPRSLLSIGAGNGVMEAQLATGGFQVLATDVAESALRISRARGLRTCRFALLEDTLSDRFDVLYLDGLVGHLWSPKAATRPMWSALAELAHTGAIVVMSNDLSDDDGAADFAVTGHPDAHFFRPPRRLLEGEARESRLWEPIRSFVYPYRRPSGPRRREVVALRLLVDDRVEAQDRPQLG